jgi:hypothetical protein
MIALRALTQTEQLLPDQVDSLAKTDRSLFESTFKPKCCELLKTLQRQTM